ncbi:MAG: hypothetical protein KJZ53_05845 [Anaerolineales bacterium]|nr:hypothetical protein [Anaerolineales bacterium]
MTSAPPFVTTQKGRSTAGRLLITGKITGETYDQLQEKLRNVELGLAELERDAKVRLDDLDLAIGLLRELVDYYFWLEDKQKATLPQLLGVSTRLRRVAKLHASVRYALVKRAYTRGG